VLPSVIHTDTVMSTSTHCTSPSSGQHCPSTYTFTFTMTTLAGHFRRHD